MQRIVLVRHGKPAWSSGTWIAGRDLEQWNKGRDDAPLDPSVEPPPALVTLAAGAGIIAASTLRRALESAAWLRPGVPPVVDAVFREIPTPPTVGSGLRLPAKIWNGYGRIRWRVSAAPEIETRKESGMRAERAASLLEALARKHGSVLLAGHGIMNGLIGKTLRRRAWEGPTLRGRRFWAFRIFEKP